MSSAKSHATTIRAIPPVRQKEECADKPIEIGRVKVTEAGRQREKSLRRSSRITQDANGKLEKPDFLCRGALTFWEPVTVRNELNRPEEEMVPLRPYTALSTAAARPFS
jgi:hypothetical protein